MAVAHQQRGRSEGASVVRVPEASSEPGGSNGAVRDITHGCGHQECMLYKCGTSFHHLARWKYRGSTRLCTGRVGMGWGTLGSGFEPEGT